MTTREALLWLMLAILGLLAFGAMLLWIGWPCC
jgi:hypothetical protein